MPGAIATARGPHHPRTREQGQVGLASYHFLSDDKAYINYEAAPDTWRTRDGAPPPARKYFESPSYDPASRTFRGTIHWGEQPLSGNSATWVYVMHFSDDLQSIDSGEVRSYRLDGAEERDPIRFGVDLVYEQVMEELALFPVH